MRQNKELVMLVIAILKFHTGNVHINTFFELRLEFLQDKVAQFVIGALQVKVVYDNVKVAGRRSVSEFNLGCVEALSEALFSFCVSLS